MDVASPPGEPVQGHLAVAPAEMQHGTFVGIVTATRLAAVARSDDSPLTPVPAFFHEVQPPPVVLGVPLTECRSVRDLLRHRLYAFHVKPKDVETAQGQDTVNAFRIAPPSRPVGGKIHPALPHVISRFRFEIVVKIRRHFVKLPRRRIVTEQIRKTVVRGAEHIAVRIEVIEAVHPLNLRRHRLLAQHIALEVYFP